MKEQRYWLAINQATCAMCEIPATADQIACSPVPEQLIGFKTHDEAKALQTFLLTAPIEEVNHCARTNGFDPREVKIIRPANPEEPTDATCWTIRPQEQTT
jgi:hypothetical protein